MATSLTVGRLNGLFSAQELFKKNQTCPIPLVPKTITLKHYIYQAKAFLG